MEHVSVNVVWILINPSNMWEKQKLKLEKQACYCTELPEKYKFYKNNIIQYKSLKSQQTTRASIPKLTKKPYLQLVNKLPILIARKLMQFTAKYKWNFNNIVWLLDSN